MEDYKELNSQISFCSEYPYFECSYLEETYREYDTGYREYECELGFCCEKCPYEFKYKVVE